MQRDVATESTERENPRCLWLESKKNEKSRTYLDYGGARAAPSCCANECNRRDLIRNTICAQWEFMSTAFAHLYTLDIHNAHTRSRTQNVLFPAVAPAFIKSERNRRIKTHKSDKKTHEILKCQTLTFARIRFNHCTVHPSIQSASANQLFTHYVPFVRNRFGFPFQWRRRQLGRLASLCMFCLFFPLSL